MAHISHVPDVPWYLAFAFEAGSGVVTAHGPASGPNSLPLQATARKEGMEACPSALQCTCRSSPTLSHALRSSSLDPQRSFTPPKKRSMPPFFDEHDGLWLAGTMPAVLNLEAYASP